MHRLVTMQSLRLNVLVHIHRSVPGCPRSSAVFRRIVTTFSAFKLGNLCFTSAADPDTLGAAYDVPSSSS